MGVALSGPAPADAGRARRQRRAGSTARRAPADAGRARRQRRAGSTARRAVLAAALALGPLIAVPAVTAGIPAGATPPASVQPTEAAVPAGSVAGGQFDPAQLACPSTSWCVAVGSESMPSSWSPNGESGYFAGSAASWTDPVAEILSGGSWSIEELPLPSGAGPTDLAVPSAVACAAAGSCVAVGTYADSGDDDLGFIDTLSSGTWSPLAAPEPADAESEPADGLSGELSAVACPASETCYAVGRYENGSSDQTAMIDTLAGGWTSQSLGPSGTSSSDLTALSCAASSFCVAVGSDDGATGALVENLAGSSWTVPSLSLPEGASSGSGALSGVSCLAAGSCVAVGSYTISGSTHDDGLIVTRSGAPTGAGSWSLSSAPLLSPPGTATSYDLTSVSCTASNACVAGGWYDDSGDDQYSLVDTLSGSGWSAQSAPLAGDTATSTTRRSCGGVFVICDTYGASSEISAVACPASASCVAVGFYEDSDGEDEAMIDTLSGGSWSTSVTPEPANTGGDPDTGQDGYSDQDASLVALDCASSTICVAAGTYEDLSAVTQGLFVGLSGGSWGAAEAAASPDPDLSLDSESCPSASSCVAVGSYYDADEEQQGVIEANPTGSTTAETAPQPGDAGIDDDDTENATLDAVSCWAAGSCVAVGSYESSSGLVEGLVETLSSGQWIPTTAEPSGAETVQLSAVSCASAGSCVATGQYLDANDDPWPLIGSLSGGSWQWITAPEPNGAATGDSENESASLDSLSCPPGGTCVAVGSYADQDGNTWGLLEVGSGTSFTASQAPDPSDATDAELGQDQVTALESVSCAAAGSCAAVGSYLDQNGQIDGLADDLTSGSFAAGSWSSSAAGLPDGAAGSSELSSVSCPPGGGCIAVGYYYDSDDSQWGLVDTYSGTTWAGTAATEPAGAGSDDEGEQVASLDSVDCASAQWCVAAGTYEDSNSATWGYVVTGSSASWDSTELAEPPDAAGAFPDGPNVTVTSVGCDASGGCVVGGSYVDGGPSSEGLSDWLTPPAPVVSGVAPGSGPSSGGTGVTVSGSYFFPAAAVSFAGAPATVSTTSATSLVVISPAGSGASDVQVTTDGGTSALVAADEFTYGADSTTTTTTTMASSTTTSTTAGSTTTTTAGSTTTSTTTAGSTTTTQPGSTTTTQPGSTTTTQPGSTTTTQPGSTTTTQPSGGGGFGTPGTLSLATAPTMYWEFELDGYDQWASASASPLSSCGPAEGGRATSCAGGSEPILAVGDQTGSGEGWAIDASLTGSAGLPEGARLSFDGAGSVPVGTSVDSPLSSFPYATVTPSTTCDEGSSCTPAAPASSCSIGLCPSDPVQIGLAQTDLFSASPGSGMGDLCLASGTPTAPDCAGMTPTAFFELGLPASALASSYLGASITLTISSGP